MKKELLSQVYQHQLISSDELQKIIDSHQKITLKKGDFILKEGEIANSYFILENGLIRSFAYDYNGNDITTDFFCNYDVVIEVLSLFQRTPTQENIQALTDCIGWKIDLDVFQDLYHSIPGVSEWGRHWMTGKLFQSKQRFLEMITTSAKNRYENLIKEKPQVILQSPLKHIASYLGITDTSFSRIRKEIS
ncbi:MAG: Crp/Fnr family transcriptional regulator [Flavobacteriaceae bacterium]|jgi:CRP-like cAMP-binding protein|nr:Crp/Fnr family transcriptional regulator [Flavobacteriaceae bacterium]